MTLLRPAASPTVSLCFAPFSPNAVGFYRAFSQLPEELRPFVERHFRDSGSPHGPHNDKPLQGALGFDPRFKALMHVGQGLIGFAQRER